MFDAATLLGLLVAGHALADYPLQGDFLAKAKSRLVPGVPWYQAMSAHCSIHAGFVLALTNSPALAVAEFIIHFVADDAKCKGRISYNMDQAIHVGCKVAWVVLTVGGSNG